MKTKFILFALFAMLVMPVFGQTYDEYRRYHRAGETFEQYKQRVNPSLKSRIGGAVAEAVIGTAVDIYNKDKEAAQQAKNFKIYPVKAPEAVDLGLPSGVLWGSFNLGATKPEGEGNRYAWGETNPKNKFTRDNYKYYQPEKVTKTGGGKDADGFDIPVKETKVPESWTDLGKDISGTEFDAATAALGDGWRMPSINDLRELNRLCKWEKTSKNDVKGFKITGPNGKWIFLPEVFVQDYVVNKKSDGSETTAFNDVTGVFYWTSSLDNYLSSHAFCITGEGSTQGACIRWDGFAIRPIKGGMTEAQKVEAAEKARIEELKRQEQEAAEMLKRQEQEAAEMKQKEVEMIKQNYIDLGTGVYWSVSNFEANAVHETGTFVAGSNIEQLNKTLPYTKSSLRVPTKEQINDLIQKCTWEKTTVDGVTGYKVTGKNGNSIFFPCGGNSKNKEAGEAFYLWSADAKEMMGLMFHEYMIHKKGKVSYKFGSVDDKFTLRLVLVPSGLD